MFNFSSLLSPGEGKRGNGGGGGKGGGRIPISEISPSKNIPPSKVIFFSPSALISEMNPSSLGVRTHGWEKEMRASGAF